MPFEHEDAETVAAAMGIRFVWVENDAVIGYIAGYVITQPSDDFPYFEQQLASLHEQLTQQRAVYTSHFVVHPDHRQKGIGSALVDAYMAEARLQAEGVVVVGWVQSDTGRWAAARQFLRYPFEEVAYIARYFEPYNVYCPNCNGRCYCDAHIFSLSFTDKQAK